jgi:hypothetical protein
MTLAQTATWMFWWSSSHHVPGLNFVSMERELSRLMQKFLNVRIREQVLREAEPLYTGTAMRRLD